MKKQWITISDTHKETTIEVKHGLAKPPHHLMFWHNLTANVFVARFKAMGFGAKLETVEYRWSKK